MAKIIILNNWEGLIRMDNLEIYNPYLDELKKWNKAINLISEKSPHNLVSRHLLDSLQLIQYIDIKNEKIIDIGSGAGFPGMVLAISGASSIKLIEPSFKKAAFLEHVKNIYKLEVLIDNCKWQHLTVCDATVVVSRAFASLKELLNAMFYVSRETIRARGYFLKGEKLNYELAEAKCNWDFDYEIFQSQTSDGGKIIKVWGLKKYGG